MGGCGIFDDSNTKADRRLKQILEVIKAQDKDALKKMFSKQALNETNDFDDKLDALFYYVQGSIQTWESTGGYSGSDEKNIDGTNNRRKKIQAAYIFTTSEQEYRIAIYEFTVDTANPNNIGLYSFCVISSCDDNYSEFTFWGNGEAGINIGKGLP